jgi:hypothetical protein
MEPNNFILANCKGWLRLVFMYYRCWTVDYAEEARSIVTHKETLFPKLYTANRHTEPENDHFNSFRSTSLRPDLYLL